MLSEEKKDEEEEVRFCSFWTKLRSKSRIKITAAMLLLALPYRVSVRLLTGQPLFVFIWSSSACQQSEINGVSETEWIIIIIQKSS